MTRINTNVSSLIAQKNLARSNDSLQESLTRLSTGLRINTGKDDPAGLIASESLRSNIVSVQKGISNSQTANQLISTADSALGQVSSLLNDIRSLVVESASSGGLSAEQIAANQLQVDSSLGAIDRIAQTTQFQGRRLLDGSLDFLTTSSTPTSAAAAGTFGSVADVVATTTIGTAGKVQIDALTAGTAYNGFSVNFVSGATAGSETVAVNLTTKAITVGIASGTSTAAQIVSALGANSSFAGAFTASVATAGTSGAATSKSSAGVDGNQFTLTAKDNGAAYNGVSLVLATGAATGSETASYDASTKTLTVNYNDNSNKSQIVDAINAEGHFSAAAIGSTAATYSSGTTASVTVGGTDGFDMFKDLKINQANFGTASSIAVNVAVDNQATQGKLTYSGGQLSSDLVLEIGGKKGFNVFNFGNGSSISTIRDAINQLSDATGVQAAVEGANLVLKSQDYGSNAFVSARALSGTFATKDTGGSQVTRDTGDDVALRINGIKAVGDGLKASLNSATLDLSFSISSLVGDNSSLAFTISGGGANFQLGPEVVSNQQARLGIQGVGTATLGGVSGKLYELKSGGAKSLSSDVTGAANVVTEVINSVTSLRGRLGAFQKTTLQTNINSLSDTLSNLTQAESNIRDADFATETAKLTQSQILVQAGTSVLQISNQRPQAVLSLLQR